ncbi:MAG: baseplate J/gp47 family protein [Clostridia bacterium]
MKEQVKKEILKRANSYVPEWTQNDRDIGSALIDIYAELHSDSLARIDNLRQKRNTQYFNKLNTVQKPAIPAKGYVTFGLSNDQAPGTVVYKNSALTTTRTYSDGTSVNVETVDDVFVTPAKIDVIMQSKGDYIAKKYEDFNTLLSANDTNLQEHEFVFRVENVINLKNTGKISLSFYESKSEKISYEKLVKLISFATFYYSTKEEYKKFKIPNIEKGKIILEKEDSTEIEPFFEDEFSSIKIKTTRADVFEDFKMRDIKVSSKADFVKPDGINAVGVQYDGKEEFYPFSEKANLYNEVYFSCEEALSKKGSKIEIDFIMDFQEILSDTFEEEIPNYKVVMKKKDVKRDPVYDITIEEVVFEYFNGYGFVNLFANKKYSDIFSTKKGLHRQRQSIEFICPNDMEQTIVNGNYGRFIRARINKMNNAYKLKSKYISPIISNLNFSFEYLSEGNRPNSIRKTNNLTTKELMPSCFDGVYPLSLFETVGESKYCVYFGLSQPIIKGPVKILFDIAYSVHGRKLIWQYYTKKGFKNLDLLDETSGLAHTGIITIKDLFDHEKVEIFGESKYFLRLVDIDEHIKAKPIRLNGIHLNSVSAIATKSGIKKSFSATTFDSDYTFDLEEKNVHSAQVFVDESENLYNEEIDKERIFIDNNGKTWVQWIDIEKAKSYETRVYFIDKVSGVLKFLPNKKLPSVSEEKNIFVTMSVGGGKETNLLGGEIMGLELSYSFVSQATNLIEFFGGADVEDEYIAKDRASSEFQNKMRAVTERDYEKLIQYYSRNISRVNCFSNTDIYGDLAKSKVTIVVLTKNYAQNSIYFESFKTEILEYLSDKILHGMKDKISIIPPNFVRFNIQTDLKVKSFNDISSTRESVLSAISQFLDPIYGNFNKKGFDISKPPKREQIESLIQDIKTVDTIKSLVITGEIYNGRQMVTLNQEEIFRIPFVLPQNGEHIIKISLD